jgi:4-hydroxythreonine-4-phosphate dehydrogenase
LSGQEKYDAVIAAYHDQGLIPLKHCHLKYELYCGLNKVRTPDHGTAYDIMKSYCRSQLFYEAVYLVLDVYRSRAQYEVTVRKPLKIKENTSKEKKITSLLVL